MATSKLTIDLTQENRETLEKIKSEQRIPYGSTINELIHTFGSIPDSIKKEMISFIKQKMQTLYKEMDTAGVLQLEELNHKSQSYAAIAAFLNNGKKVTIDKATSLKKIPILDGFLLCPENWIIVNPDAAENSLYACVIECRNSAKYGVPHFVVFTQRQYVKDYSAEDENYIFHLCSLAYPKFKEILKMQVKPIEDPDHPGLLLNADLWLNAPTIGIFDIYVNGDPKFGPDYEPIYGARIVPTSPSYYNRKE
jgi:hypothetical protein